MTRIYALLAVATAFMMSFASSQVIESRGVDAILPLLPTALINVINFENITVFITIEDLLKNMTSLSFNIQNPLLLELTVDEVAVNARLNGTVFATFTHSFPSPGLVVPALSIVNSGTIDNVALPAGPLGLLSIIPFGILDLSNTNASIRELTISGSGGLPIPLSGLTQASVPTNYSLASCVPS